MKIKGAIFDLDGTLLDSMYMWENIGRDYLLDLGIEPDKDINEKIKTMSLVQAAEYIKDRYGLKMTSDEIIAGVTGKIAHFYTNEVKLKKGAADFLGFLQSKRVKMCIATASDTGLVEAALRLNGIESFFDGIFTCTEIGAGKDSPEIYNAALRYLDTEKAETIVFEDAYHAVSTAKKAGFNVVGIYDAFEKDNEENIKELADKFIYSYDELR